MEQLEIKGIVSNCKDNGFVEESGLLQVIGSKILGEAHVYALLDHAVALGLFQNGKIAIGLGNEKKVVDLPFVYLQELRVFDENREFRAVRIDGKFRWRTRCDNGEGERINAFDETYKLWGAVKYEEDVGRWSVLRSRRGSAIYYPGEVKLNGERGIRIRNYIEFHDSCKGDGLMHFVDERLCGFVEWPPKERGSEHGVV